MKQIKSFYRFSLCLLSLASLGLSSCEDEVVTVTETMPTYNVFVFLPVGGLGDGGYSDQIMLGTSRYNVSHEAEDYAYVYLAPSSVDAAAKMLDQYINDPAIPQSRNLYVLAGSEYVQLLNSHLEKLVEANSQYMEHRTILLFETDGPGVRRITEGSLLSQHLYTFQVCTYGASYQAGVSAHTLSPERVPLVWLATADATLDSFVLGFTEGYKTASGGKQPDVKYLADDHTGYTMADSTYRAMNQLSSQYDFIFPVMGSSNMGIYRYQRENDQAPYAVGMDVDQSGYSKKVVGSVTKNVAEVIYNQMEAWHKGTLTEQHQVFGLSTQSSSWVISSQYQSLLSPISVSSLNAAEAAEADYLK